MATYSAVLRFVFAICLASRAFGAAVTVQVCRCGGCAALGGNALAAFERLAGGGVGVDSAILEGCEAGPSARVLVDGDAALFGAADMDEGERRTKVFRNVATDADAARVFGLAARLNDRLASLETEMGQAWPNFDFLGGTGPEFAPAARPAAPPQASPPAFFQGYDAVDLQSILDMHVGLLDGGLEEDELGRLGETDPESIVDMHEQIRRMVEGPRRSEP
mmetsp:Transcript_4270/g.15681  ORF Transcript_4270/g.15681 Transcript_4270/m.15681 type:complete len:220 (+) Transcript_4270:62-721(+)